MTSIERQANLIWSTRVIVPHSLGVMEDIAVRYCSILNTLNPEVEKPVLVLAAANHGIAKHNVTVSSENVTSQMFNLFKKKKGTCGILCRQNNVEINCVDVGIDFPTGDFSKTKAMSEVKFSSLIKDGIKHSKTLYENGTNTVLLGEMGVGNTTSSGAVMCALTGIDPKFCVSFNPNKEILQTKQSIICQSVKTIEDRDNVKAVCSKLGGKEIVYLAGVVLGAFENNMVVISDGFNTDVSVLIASKIKPECVKNVLFSHNNGQDCHKKLQSYLKAEPLTDLKMRLGEGSSALTVLPLIRNSLSVFNNLDSFRSSAVDCFEKEKRLPFAVGTSSYILPADIRKNVEFLKDKVEDIELVLFESNGETNIPDDALISYLKKTAQKFNLTYTVHLPYDVKAASFSEKERAKAVRTFIKFIKATSSLPVHGYIVHLEPDDYTGPQPSKDIERWTKSATKSLYELKDKLPKDVDSSLICIETLGYDITPYLKTIKECHFSLTLDVGHLFRFGFYTKAYVKKLLPLTRIIHLHGVDEKLKDHCSIEKHYDKEKLNSFLDLLFDYEKRPIVLTLEIFSKKELESSLRYLSKRGVFNA